MEIQNTPLLQIKTGSSFYNNYPVLKLSLKELPTTTGNTEECTKCRRNSVSMITVNGCQHVKTKTLRLLIQLTIPINIQNKRPRMNWYLLVLNQGCLASECVGERRRIVSTITEELFYSNWFLTEIPSPR